MRNERKRNIQKRDCGKDGRENAENRMSRKSFRNREYLTVSNKFEKSNTKTKMCPFSSYRPFGDIEDRLLLLAYM